METGPRVVGEMSAEAGPEVSPKLHTVMNEVLRSIRLEGTLYFEARLSGSWGFEVAEGANASFHHVVEGTCWAHTAEGGWFALSPGSTMVFPHGAAHCVAHEKSVASPVDGQRLFEHVDDQGVLRLEEGPGPEVRLVCGHFSTDRTLDHPLWNSLPPVVFTRTAPATWSTLASLAVERARDQVPGAAVLTDRLAELLLIEVLSSLDEGKAPAFVRSLGDPVVAAALQAIHDDPAAQWDVRSLASRAAVSRSTLSQRFTDLVGESPMRYVQRWRLHLAARMLRETDLTTEVIAARVGYATPFSLSKAFSREVGQSPSRYRESAQAS